MADTPMTAAPDTAAAQAVATAHPSALVNSSEPNAVTAPAQPDAAPVSSGSLPALGRLKPVAPRVVWPHEAHHFTPWLLANADVLGDLLGMDLELEMAEHPVGGFSLDLIGRDAATGDVVIVENQLEGSDHTHLGQILTYAAGTDPTTVVWVAASFRPEHRSALAWLNQRTDEDTRFFGVEIGVVRIGQSEPAPSFRLVVQPDDWEKTVRAATTAADPVSGKRQLYRQFWERWIERLRNERPAWSRATRPPAGSWFTMSTGSAGATFYTSFTKQGLSSELVFEDGDATINTARFQVLYEVRDRIDEVYLGSLEYQELPARKSTLVVEYLPGADVTVEEEWDTYLDWMLDRQTRLRAALDAVGGIPSAH